MTLREGGPLISQCVRERIIFSYNVEEFDSTCEEGSNSVVQLFAIDGVYGISIDNFVYDLPRISKEYQPGDGYCV